MRGIKSGLQTEEQMRRKFWQQVKQLKACKKIGQFDIFAISNNQRSAKSWAQGKDKLEGVTKGVADYCVPGIGFMEAKRVDRINKNGSIHVTTQEPEQIEFQAAMEAKGQKYALFWTPQQGIDILCEWLKVKL